MAEEKQQQGRTISEIDRQFENLWEGRVPRGVSVIKRQRFRNWLQSKMRQRGVSFSKGNAKSYWNGVYSEMEIDMGFATPSSRRDDGPPGQGRGRGPPRGRSRGRR